MAARRASGAADAFIEELLLAPSKKALASRLRKHAQRIDRAAAEALFRRFLALVHEDRARARRALDAGVLMVRARHEPSIVARVERIAGTLDHLAGRERDASKRLAQAARNYEAAGELIHAGDVHRVLIDVHLNAGAYTRARASATRARQLYKRGGGADAFRRAALSSHLGHLHHRLDEHDAALSCYRSARRDFSRARQPLRVAEIDYNQANILATLDRTDEARRLYESARERFAEAGLAHLEAQADYAIAAIELQEGALDDAVDRLRATRARQRAQGDDLAVAHSELELGEALVRLNRPDEAAEPVRRAEAFFKAAGHLADEAAAAVTLGTAALRRGHAGRARRYFDRAASLRERQGNRVAAALCALGRAQASLAAERPDDAEPDAAAAARTLARKGLKTRAAFAWAVAAEAARALGRIPLARNRARRALELAKSTRDARSQLAARLVLARLERARGRDDLELRQLRGAEACIDRLRRGVSTEESRLAFAADKSEVYEALVLNRLQRGDVRSIRQALVFAERGKARALAERLALDLRSGEGRTSPRARKLLSRLRTLDRDLALAESRLEERSGAKPPGVRATRAARLAGERLALLEELERVDPAQAELAGLPPREPIHALRNLGPGEIVLAYTEAGGHYHLFVAEGARLEVLPRLVRRGPVDELLERLRFLLGKGVLGAAHSDDYKVFIAQALDRVFERLHAQLLAPVAERLVGKRVMIIPHGPLHGLPFHALQAGGRPLVEDAVVSYAPSLSVLSLLGRRARRRFGPPLVVGSADDATPAIDEEVRKVARRIGVSRVLRGAAVDASVLEHAADTRPRVLHIASHGFFAEGDGLRGALKLGSSWIPLRHLYALNDTADLVVLSGCETARGSVHSGDEWAGLVRGFLQAGARSVIGALWEVYDRAASDLMDDFYESLAGGVPAAEALALAQRRARAADPCALVWAPFALTGDPRMTLSLKNAERGR